MRAELYSFKTLEGKREKKCKGVKKHVIKKNISHEDNTEGLFNGSMQMRKLNVVRSHEHEIFTETIKHWIAANDHVKAQEEQNFADSD